MQRAVRTIYIGFDHREAAQFAVCRNSIRRHLRQPIEIRGLVLPDLQAKGLYKRPTEVRDGRLFDVISDHPMATEFALSRFLVPRLAGGGLALFMDCDMLVRRDLGLIFDVAERFDHPLMCVKHQHRPTSDTKMDGQVQSAYERKNWSSFMIFRAAHAAHRDLPKFVNEWRGLHLHQMRWLEPDRIGALPLSWNWLAGVSEPDPDPAVVHYTEGAPSMAGYEDSPFADEWRAELSAWAS